MRHISMVCLTLALLPFPAKAAPIQDNSFLVEEAYNQEAGVVQHINTFNRAGNGDWNYSFTQEWPVFSQLHQFSYTVPFQALAPNQGIGDLMLNYRYQLLGDGSAPIAISPRLSLSLPTGDTKSGLGYGAYGLQVNLPVSVVLSDSFVSHTNLGTTVFSSKTGYNAGQSIIWLLTPTFNPMLELFWSRLGNTDDLYLSPGLRWAHDFPSGLQIVPGIAAPIGIGPSQGKNSLFLYLSLEHPFI